MLRLALLLALAVAGVPSATAAPRGRAAECRLACGDAIGQCVAGGQRRGKCRRSILRRCKRTGTAVCATTAAGPFHVATTGVDAAGCGGPDVPCRTIQFVVDQLVPLGGAAGVRVAAGTYDDRHACAAGTTPNDAVVCILNKRITLVGGFLPPDWDTVNRAPASTVIDGGGAARGIRIARTAQAAPAASLDLTGFTIRNGLAQGDASGDASRTSAFGGGIYAEHAALAIADVDVRASQAIGGSTSQAEGGRGAGGGLAVNNADWSAAEATATLTRVTFAGNAARGGGGADHGGYALGGGLFAYFATVNAADVTFDGNAAVGGPTNGPGAGADKGDALGGAVAAEVSSSVTLTRALATGNAATGGAAPNGEAGGGYGGALYAEGAALAVADSVVRDNVARGGDGRNLSTSASLAEGGGVFAIGSPVTLDRVVVGGNEARAGDGARNGGAVGGGGIAAIRGSGPGVDAPLAVRNAVVSENRVTLGTGTLVGGGGGGVFLQGVAATIEHATIAGNALGGDHLLGAGILEIALAGWQTTLAVRNAILANHTSASFDPSVYFDAALFVGDQASADVAGVLFAGNRHDSNAGVAGGWNLPPGAIALSGVATAADAGFVSPGEPSRDYHLLPGSPAIDQGTGAVPVDLDGTPRPVGAAPDLGAYEFTP